MALDLILAAAGLSVLCWLAHRIQRAHAAGAELRARLAERLDEMTMDRIRTERLDAITRSRPY